MVENYSGLDARIKRELELIQQMTDHDLLMKIAEKVIQLEHKVGLQDRRLWGLASIFALAFLPVLVKTFLT